MRRALLEQARTPTHATRQIAARVDHRVPCTFGKRAKPWGDIGVAVTGAPLDRGAKGHRRASACKDGHVATTRERGLDHVPAEELRPAENQQLHRRSRSGRAWTN